MCGIAGIYDIEHKRTGQDIEALVISMSDAVIHRGPDGYGVWVDENINLAFSHRRLSIIDLSEGGHQPMQSANGRYVITFNGEIYNFQSLKIDLIAQGYVFSGTSDTEVLLASIEIYGLESTLEKCNGMFAFALWDKETKTLSLARDRVGKKPLYYGWSDEDFLFASELKSLRAMPEFSAEISPEAMAQYMRFGYVPAPLSIYKGIHKLPAGCFVSFSLAQLQSRNANIRSYWSLAEVAEHGQKNISAMPDDQAIDALDHVLNQSVTSRMISDVPLGAFLSGGIDSSLITAVMQKNSTTPIKTFSIGFEETGYNEAAHAKKIADYLGTDHTEFYVTAEEARSVIASLPDIYDEPFADPSEIPTILLSRLAKTHVTVALSGDGGDESFCGYKRYARYGQTNALRYLPFKSAVQFLLNKIPVPAKFKTALETLSYAMKAKNDWAYYKRLMSYWKLPEERILSKTFSESGDDVCAFTLPKLKRFSNKMMYHDSMHYLPDDILVKVDRASMAASLEVRAPLLDYKILEYAWQMPFSMKRRRGQGKWALQEILTRYIPRALFDRPKQGFGIPHSEWISGPLREWAEDLLDEDYLRQQGVFCPDVVRKQWAEHLSGRHNRGYNLWTVLMFQLWYRRWCS